MFMEMTRTIFGWIITALYIFSNFTIPASALTKAVNEAILLDVPFISQTALKGILDTNGRPYTLGNSDTLLWSYGCGVSSIAMIYGYYGLQTSLVDMNVALKQEGGFYKDFLSWIIYEKSSKTYINNPGITNPGLPWIKNFQLVFTNKPETYKEKIDAELSEKHPVMVFLGGKHFVVLVGKDEKGNYLINDPWKSGATEGKGILITKNVTGMGFKNITEIIFFSPEDYSPTNGIPVTGKIAKKYISLGGSRGVLGNPVPMDNLANLLDGLYPWQKFEHGIIIQIEERTAAIYGELWESLSSLNNPLYFGLPLGDVYSYPTSAGARWEVDFENASMVWVESSGDEEIEIYYSNDSYLQEFFDGDNFNVSLVHYRYVPNILIDIESGRPGAWISQENYAVRWTGTFTTGGLIAWWYTFKVPTTGHLTVWVDGEKKYDLQDGGNEGKFTTYLKKGEHTLTVEYIKTSLVAKAKVSWHTWPDISNPFIAHAAEGDVVQGSIDSRPASVTDYLSTIPTPEPIFTPTAVLGNPDQPVRDFFDGLNNLDAVKASGAIVSASRIWVQPVLEEVLSALQASHSSVKFIIQETSHQMIDETNAVVEVSGLVDVNLNDGATHTSREITFQMPVLQVEGAWYIRLNIDKLMEILKELQYYLT